ncbi:MAG: tRNA modification GTPase MnmE [Phycisphaerae bacterium]|nr:MAG: tRNA modification GTPase MnmE [Phycisphaerae bacterium]
MDGASSTYADVDDTIVAVCTARGIAPRGIVRLSGPDAFSIAQAVFEGASADALTQRRGFRCVRGDVVFDKHHRAPAHAYTFTQPHSYTRQDSVELHTMGAAPLLEMLVERCIRAGARSAHPGEFTARAYLSGALTLSAAEAVASTIHARTDAQLRAARKVMRGDLRDTIASWQNALADLLSLVVADIDFAEEPIDFISTDELGSKVSDLHARLQDLIHSSESQARIEAVPHVLLLGLPNAGKSTLLNALTGIDRAIASAVSGTTRDILSAPATLDGIEAILLDSAGVDDSPDQVLVHARQRAEEEAGRVDLLCIIVDVSESIDVAAIARLRKLANGPTMFVGTKIDLVSASKDDLARKLGESSGQPACLVSAATSEGLGDLRAAMARQLVTQATDAEHSAITLTTNQHVALTTANEALVRCIELTTTSDNLLDIAELVALELREALDSLALTTGSVSTDDLLGRIFSSFCIGK